MKFHAIFTLIVFLAQNLFVLFPLKIYKFELNLMTAPPIAVGILLLATIPIQVFINGILGNDFLRPYNIMILFISLAYLALSLHRTGLLKYLAFKIAQSTVCKSPKHMLGVFYVFSLLSSIILGNAPIILAATGFLVHFSKKSKLNPIPFVFTEFYSSNLGSLVLFTGDPTNLLICEAFQVSYMTYSKMILLPFLGCALVCYLISIYQFREMLVKEAPESNTPVTAEINPVTAMESEILEDVVVVVVDDEDPTDENILVDPTSAVFGSIIFVFCIVTLIITSFFNINAWIVSLSFTLVKIVFDILWDIYNPSAQDLETHIKYPRISYLYKTIPTATTTFINLPFDLVIFAFSQFILVEALDYYSLIDTFAVGLGYLTTSLPSTIFFIAVLTITLSAIMGTNITATIILARVILKIPLDGKLHFAAWMTLALGSNVAAINLTVSASLSGLLWKEVLDLEQVHITQKTFSRYNWKPMIGMFVLGFSIVYLQALI